MKSTNLSVTIIGCGWLGFPLGKELVHRGYSVNGSTRNEYGFEPLREAGIQPLQLDLERSTSVPTELINSTDVLVISIPPLHRDEPKKFQIILTQFLEQFPRETHVIFTSSTGIYPQSSGNFDENFKFSEAQDSTILNLAENAIRLSNNPHVIFRLGGLIGPNRHPIRFLQGRENVKDPNGVINFVHQGDCIRAIIQAIENKQMHGTFNLVYPSYPTRKNYYISAANQYGLDAPNFSDDTSINRVISSEKIVRDVNFHFLFPIDHFPELKFD